MSYGFSFIDVLVSPITMVLAVIIFLLCCWILLFKRKTTDLSIKALSVLVLIITGIYIGFIIWAITGFGGGFR